MTQDRPVLGILLMLGFCVMAPLGDALAKLLGGEIDVAELVAIRMGVQALVLVPVVWWLGLSLAPVFGRFRLITIRAVLHMVGIGMMFLSLRYLPLADAVAIAFVMPFIMLILGHFVLGEEVGIRRIVACGVGFIGTLMVIQPSLAEVGWIAALPLSVAFIFAVFMLVTRQIAKDADPLALQAVGGMVGVPILLVLLLVPTDLPDLSLSWPSGVDVWLLIAMGVLGTVAHLLMTWSLRFAPSATLAPMQYLEIPVATVLGLIFFEDLPDGLAAAGIALTVAAGLYIIWRERVTSRAQPA